MTKRTSRNRQLEEAMTSLIQSQAMLTQNQATFMSQMVEMNSRLMSIEQDLGTIKAILIRHEQILQGLPEAIREKIGFKPAK